MINYTGWQWLLIDAANQYGLDKLNFEDRIIWAERNLHQLNDPVFIAAGDAKTRPLYIKAVMAIQMARKGIPTGHLVGVDGICSGIQIMSAMTGCISGATATGLVDPTRRADAYSDTTKRMAEILGNNFNVARADAKQALMTVMYGSKKTPKEIFGDGTPELKAFYQAAKEIAPGAWDLLQDLRSSWRPFALEHSWKLPDGFDARVKVMVESTVRLEIDELNGASFSYKFEDNIGQEKGLSNIANVTHSMDAFVLREMHRRCNYKPETLESAALAISAELGMRKRNLTHQVYGTDQTTYYRDQWDRCGIATAAILPYLNADSVSLLDTDHLKALDRIAMGMLQSNPFPLITIHDEFKAHPNNINQVRYHYKEILADIADGNAAEDILNQIHGVPGGCYHKLSFNLSDLIRRSNYALS